METNKQAENVADKKGVGRGWWGGGAGGKPTFAHSDEHSQLRAGQKAGGRAGGSGEGEQRRA